LKKTKRRKRLRRLIAALVVLACVPLMAPFVVSWMLPSAIVAAPNLHEVIDPTQDARYIPADATQLRVRVGPPLAALACLVLNPPKGVAPKGTVFLLHGIRDRKESLLGMGRRLAKKGLRAVACDHRGHGRSTGSYLRYGAVEGRDMKQVVLRLEQLKLLATPLYAVGFSYGGSVAIQLAAREPRVEKVVSISTFSSLAEVVPNYIETFLPVLHHLVSASRIKAGLKEAGRIASFDPDDANTARAARQCSAKILILHGDSDRKIYPAHAKRLAKAAAKRAKLIIIAGEGHDSMMADRKGKVRQAIDNWLLER
jgi:pimeloyl-ACP methyl ester carboxylesterase